MLVGETVAALEHMDTSSTPSECEPQKSSHELEHVEVYLNMVCYISKTPINELIVEQPDVIEEEDDDDGHASSFGHNMPSLSSASSKSSKISHDTDVSAHQVLKNQKFVQKSASMLHTEGIVWQSILKEHASVAARQSNTFGAIFLQVFPATIPSLSPLLDMLCQADPNLDFHALIYHIASMVAIQHYIRLTVLRTGQFAPQKVINMQRSYYHTLLFGLLNTTLTSAQQHYVQTYTHVPA